MRIYNIIIILFLPLLISCSGSMGTDQQVPGSDDNVNIDKSASIEGQWWYVSHEESLFNGHTVIVEPDVSFYSANRVFFQDGNVTVEDKDGDREVWPYSLIDGVVTIFGESLPLMRLTKNELCGALEAKRIIEPLNASASVIGTYMGKDIYSGIDFSGYSSKIIYWYYDDAGQAVACNYYATTEEHLDGNNIIYERTCYAYDSSWICLNSTGSKPEEKQIKYEDYKYTEEEITVVAPVDKHTNLIYVVGVDDGWTNADWNFDNYLVLYNEDHLDYAGACNINSKWGYRYYTEAGNWFNYYGFAEGDSYKGGLEPNNDINVPSPNTPGLYFMRVSLVGLEYELIPVRNVTISGVCTAGPLDMQEGAIDGEYNMQEGATVGEYTLTIDVEAKYPNGFWIYIKGRNGQRYSFGGKDGLLVLNAVGCPLDDSCVGSKCQFTVDICKGTYSIKKWQKRAL